jgi:hypothetical protein
LVCLAHNPRTMACNCWCHMTMAHAERCKRQKPCHGENVYGGGMNEPHMVEMILQDECNCNDMLDRCPSRLTTEVRFIEEFVRLVQERSCMTVVKAYPIHQSRHQ